MLSWATGVARQAEKYVDFIGKEIAVAFRPKCEEWAGAGLSYVDGSQCAKKYAARRNIETDVTGGLMSWHDAGEAAEIKIRSIMAGMGLVAFILLRFQ